MKLVFATNNKNKIKEVQSMIPDHIKLLSLSDIGCTEDIPETANTIEGNAIQKAKYIKENYGYDCFADDTGLEVSALHGAPGVFSARYAGPDRDDDRNMDKLLAAMDKQDNRDAQFKTVVALLLNDNEKIITGICKGKIIKQKKGKNGFGYDPIFCPESYDQTFAELSLAVKNKISHRGKAIRELIAILKD